jgi:hypothetical protein
MFVLVRHPATLARIGVLVQQRSCIATKLTSDFSRGSLLPISSRRKMSGIDAGKCNFQFLLIVFVNSKV